MIFIEENFRDKYLKTNIATSFLINRFFRKLEKCMPQDVETVAEIGCGEGFSTERFAKLFHNKIFSASDVTLALVERAAERNKNSGVIFSVESVYSMQRHTKSVDLLLLIEVLEHLEDYKRALEELQRVSKKYVLVTVPWEPWWRFANMIRGTYLKSLGNTPGHINHWNKKRLRNLLKHYGSKVTVTTSFPWIIALVDTREASQTQTP